ncbi:hypothetical protein TNCV_4887911 [Trichonephila clavipes]|nr:hypothetical protein TNCV_4887911 [Trichonephila clavipes]
MEEILREEWSKSDQEVTENLVKSMPKRLKGVICRRGRATVTSRLETTTTSGVGFFVDSTPTRAISDPAQPLFDPRGI